MTVSWGQARQFAYDAGGPLGSEVVALAEALGRILAEPVVALVDLPGVDTVAMDGWAVCGPGPWSVLGASPAGAPRSALGPGEAVEVATGSQRPVGATGVVRAEDGALVGQQLSGRSGDGDVRLRGEQCQAGEVVLVAGIALRPPGLGLAAAVGTDTVTVRRRPRVAAVILGDEIVATGVPAAGQVRDALGPQLVGWVTALGGEFLGRAAVPDDLPSTCTALGVAAEVVVVTGGTSAGRGDYLRAALAACGASSVVDGVEVRPGRPMLLHRLPSGTLVIGLPGNPLAAIVALVTLLGPVLDGCLGRALPNPPELPAPPMGELTLPLGHRTTAVPCACRNGALTPVDHQGTAMLRGVAHADGLLITHPDGAAQWLAFPWS